MAIKTIGTSIDNSMRQILIENDRYLFENTVLRPGKNIFNKFSVIQGRVDGAPSNAGNIIPHEGIVTADYEMIESNQTYTTNQSIWYAQYDVDLNFVKWEFVASGNTFTTESNSFYIRISINEDLTNVLQVEKGNVITEYEPYMKMLKNVEIEELYKAKKSDARNKKFTHIKERFEEIERDIISLKPIGQELVDDDVAEQAFVDEMNKKAQLLGCENTTFRNSSGLYAQGQLTVPKDFTLITRHASGIEELVKVWGAKSYEVNVKGPNARLVNISTTVQNATFEQDYIILGGKTGTLGIVHNLCLVAKHKETGHVLAGTILRSSVDRWEAMKQLLDETIKRIEGNGSDSLTIESVGACSILLPQNPLLYTNTELNEIYLQGNERADLQSPASITKILTSIVLIENVPNLNETFSYKERDQVEDSLIFNPGDIVSFKDALYLMMLQSNNTTAKAVARTVGQRIVRARGYA